MNFKPITTCAILLLVLIAGLAFLWYQRRLNQRAVEFWGTSKADLIQNASEFNSYVIRKSGSKPDNPRQILDHQIGRFCVDGKLHLQRAELAKIQDALLSSDSYDWTRDYNGRDSFKPSYALRLIGTEYHFIIYFDLKNDWLYASDNGWLALTPTMKNKLFKIFQEAPVESLLHREQSETAPELAPAKSE